MRGNAEQVFGTEILTEEQADKIDTMGGALWRFTDRPMGHLYSTVAGVSFRNSNGTSRQKILKDLQPGESLDLVFEPENKHDLYACAVKRLNGQQLGYLHADLSPTVRLVHDHGAMFTVNAVHLGRDSEDSPLGLWISIINFYGKVAVCDIERYFNTYIRPDAESEDPLAIMRRG